MECELEKDFCLCLKEFLKAMLSQNSRESFLCLLVNPRESQLKEPRPLLSKKLVKIPHGGLAMKGKSMFNYPCAETSSSVIIKPDSSTFFLFLRSWTSDQKIKSIETLGKVQQERGWNCGLPSIW